MDKFWFSFFFLVSVYVLSYFGAIAHKTLRFTFVYELMLFFILCDAGNRADGGGGSIEGEWKARGRGAREGRAGGVGKQGDQPTEPRDPCKTYFRGGGIDLSIIKQATRRSNDHTIKWSNNQSPHQSIDQPTNQ